MSFSFSKNMQKHCRKRKGNMLWKELRNNRRSIHFDLATFSPPPPSTRRLCFRRKNSLSTNTNALEERIHFQQIFWFHLPLFKIGFHYLERLPFCNIALYYLPFHDVPFCLYLSYLSQYDFKLSRTSNFLLNILIF